VNSNFKDYGTRKRNVTFMSLPIMPILN